MTICANYCDAALTKAYKVCFWRIAYVRSQWGSMQVSWFRLVLLSSICCSSVACRHWPLHSIFQFSHCEQNLWHLEHINTFVQDQGKRWPQQVHLHYPPLAYGANGKSKIPLAQENKNFFSNTKLFFYNQTDQQVATATSRTKGFKILPNV